MDASSIIAVLFMLSVIAIVIVALFYMHKKQVEYQQQSMDLSSKVNNLDANTRTKLSQTNDYVLGVEKKQTDANTDIKTQLAQLDNSAIGMAQGSQTKLSGVSTKLSQSIDDTQGSLSDSITQVNDTLSGDINTLNTNLVKTNQDLASANKNITNTTNTLTTKLNDAFTKATGPRDLITAKNAQLDAINVGSKWKLSGTGDKAANDDWLRVFNKDGTDYYGGLAMGKLWTKDTAFLNGTTNANTINADQLTSKNAQVNAINLGSKWKLSGVGDKDGNDDWLRFFDKDGKGYYGGIATGKIFTRDAAYLNGTTTANTINADVLNVNNRMNIMKADPGAMLERNNGKDSDRYGIGQFVGGKMRMYASKTYAPATVNLSIAGDNNTFNDALTVTNAGDTHIANHINIQGRMHFKDSTFSKAGNATNSSDPYYLEKIADNPNTSSLRLTINDDNDESFQIWGGSCRVGNCGGPGEKLHSFDAQGGAYHKGDLTVGGKLCVGNVCVTQDQLKQLQDTATANTAAAAAATASTAATKTA
jgi:hypothetical protein